jgi:adenine phosphoribosyltransferase
MAKEFNLDDTIRKVPDFPRKGILFYDITSILTNPAAYKYCVDAMVKRYKGVKIDAVAAIESRGFLFASPFAERMGIPLILVRKKGKLPGKTVSKSYSLEYGQAEIEIHESDIPKGGRILIVDDLVATGGTLRAAADLLAEAGACPIGYFSVIGLPFLHYEDVLKGLPVDTLIEYFGE